MSKETASDFRDTDRNRPASGPARGAGGAATVPQADRDAMTKLLSYPTPRLDGDCRVPGDKSISHRALIFGALAVGRTRIRGLLEGEDVLATAAAMRAFGAGVSRDGDDWLVDGVGVGGFVSPGDVVDCGNSGTGVRLMMGLVATQPIRTIFAGDASLSSRPMERVMAPLRDMGARFDAAEGGRLPLTVWGAEAAMPIDYALPVPSAQVKSAVLLAGLNAPGTTIVREDQHTRDHTERLLVQFGAEVRIEDAGGQRVIALTGEPELTAGEVQVPGDPSSAAFPLAAGLLGGQGAVTVRNVGMNPLRTGLLTTLQEMGADLTIEPLADGGGEPLADITARPSRLKGVDVPPERAASMIDEYPVLAVLAACAEGRTRMRGVGELRVKESDRIAAMADGLERLGITVEADDDSFTVEGGRLGGDVVVASRLDHRIAMSFLVAGTAAAGPVGIDDAAPIATSFPEFVDLMRGLGADLREGEAG